MRVSKKALRPFAVILVSLSMSALLTGCQTSSDSASQAVGGSDAESTIQQQTTDASNSRRMNKTVPMKRLRPCRRFL